MEEHMLISGDFKYFDHAIQRRVNHFEQTIKTK